MRYEKKIATLKELLNDYQSREAATPAMTEQGKQILSDIAEVEKFSSAIFKECTTKDEKQSCSELNEYYMEELTEDCKFYISILASTGCSYNLYDEIKTALKSAVKELHFLLLTGYLTKDISVGEF